MSRAMIRLHVPTDLTAGAGVVPRYDQTHYLTSVMRLKAGDPVLLFNGRHGEWRAILTEVSRRGCLLAVEEQVRPQTAGPDLELIVALVKKVRLETICEKAAELGAARVRLVVTRRTNDDRARIDRLRAMAEEAAEQTGRLDVPPIEEAVKLDKLLDAWPPNPSDKNGRRLMFCDEAGDAKPVIEALAGRPQGPWAVLIGPEGGFAPEERERLRAMANTVPVSLGPRILRADTAAISALTLWQAALGDWTSPSA
jgi:16S rRNA (uracil1498-N3)-methyltransferase